MLQKIKQTTNYIRQSVSFEPEIGIILGTGPLQRGEDLVFLIGDQFAAVDDFLPLQHDTLGRRYRCLQLGEHTIGIGCIEQDCRGHF